MEVYMSNGARVEIIREPLEKETKASMFRGSSKTVPEWVRVGQELGARRIMEYLAETGRMPAPELMAEYQECMAERLDLYIREPMKYPFVPMGIREFELKGERGEYADASDQTQMV